MLAWHRALISSGWRVAWPLCRQTVAQGLRPFCAPEDGAESIGAGSARRPAWAACRVWPIWRTRRFFCPILAFVLEPDLQAVPTHGSAGSIRNPTVTAQEAISTVRLQSLLDKSWGQRQFMPDQGVGIMLPDVPLPQQPTESIKLVTVGERLLPLRSCPVAQALPVGPSTWLFAAPARSACRAAFDSRLQPAAAEIEDRRPTIISASCDEPQKQS